jgi:hypothetical protein
VAFGERRNHHREEALGRGGTAWQLRTDLFRTQMLVRRQAEPSLPRDGHSQRATSCGLSGRRSPASQARAVRAASPILRATAAGPTVARAGLIVGPHHEPSGASISGIAWRA